jgi:hypothetical protein
MRTGYCWVQRAAHILSNAAHPTAPTVKRRLGGRLGAMPHPQATAGTLAPALAHVQQVTRSYWSGRFPCYSVPALPRTKNALEQFFGAHRSHERRATGRQVASPALVLRGAVRLVAAAATRLHPCGGEARAPATLGAWKTLRKTWGPCMVYPLTVMLL